MPAKRSIQIRFRNRETRSNCRSLRTLAFLDRASLSSQVKNRYKWFSHFSVYRNPREGLFKHSPSVSDSAGVRWGLRICIPNKLPEDTDVPEATLRATAQRIFLGIFLTLKGDLHMILRAYTQVPLSCKYSDPQ